MTYRPPEKSYENNTGYDIAEIHPSNNARLGEYTGHEYSSVFAVVLPQ